MYLHAVSKSSNPRFAFTEGSLFGVYDEEQDAYNIATREAKLTKEAHYVHFIKVEDTVVHKPVVTVYMEVRSIGRPKQK